MDFKDKAAKDYFDKLNKRYGPLHMTWRGVITIGDLKVLEKKWIKDAHTNADDVHGRSNGWYYRYRVFAPGGGWKTVEKFGGETRREAEITFRKALMSKEAAKGNGCQDN